MARSIWPTHSCAPRASPPPFPASAETIFHIQEVRVVLFLRRLWELLPMSSFTCQYDRRIPCQFGIDLTSSKHCAGRQAEGSQRMCWCSTWISCPAGRAFSLSLLESRCGSAAEGATPTSTEVVADHFREVGCPCRLQIGTAGMRSEKNVAIFCSKIDLTKSGCPIGDPSTPMPCAMDGRL